MDTASKPNEWVCPQCGRRLPAGGLDGLCPACLLQQGTAADSLPPSPAFDLPSIAEVARLFPQLEILGLIGQGGMGGVYKARQRHLDRLVALKILPPAVGADPAFAGRFEREARALARLHHPHIVTLYEFGKSEGLFFLLMEFVDGVNLRQLLHAGRLSPQEALAIVPQICEALQFAHDRGIVHRDIKPENILLGTDGQVKIADFGVARIMAGSRSRGGPAAGAVGSGGSDGSGRSDGSDASDASGRSEQTLASRVVGTPAYMAPEQLERPGGVDHRADIYSLGVVFYQMLTGELPGGTVVPPSRKVVIDVRLDEVVLRALERQPERRYQQVSEVRTMVETIAGSSPADPPPAGPADWSGPWSDGERPFNKWAAAFWAALGGLGIGLLVMVMSMRGVVSARTAQLLPPALLVAALLVTRLVLLLRAREATAPAATGAATDRDRRRRSWLQVKAGAFAAAATCLLAGLFLTAGDRPAIQAVLWVVGAVGFGIASYRHAAAAAGMTGKRTPPAHGSSGPKAPNRRFPPLSAAGPAAACLGLFIAHATLVMVLADGLPARVATHFGSSGAPNGWMTRTGYLSFILAMPLGLAAFLWVLGGLVGILPPRLVNLPRRDYWLAREHRALTVLLLRRHLLGLACLMMGFFMALHVLTIRANRSSPPRLSPDHLLPVIIAFMLALIIWVTKLLMRFAETGESERAADLHVSAASARPVRRWLLPAGLLALALLASAAAWRLDYRRQVHGRAQVRYRVFEADARVVERLVPALGRMESFPADARPAPPAETTAPSHTVEIDAATLTSLLPAEEQGHGVLKEGTRDVPFSFWPALADSWSYGVSHGALSGVGGAGGFLAVRRLRGMLQLRVDYQVTHDVSVDHAVRARVFYEGPAPAAGRGRAFFIPFARDDGRRICLVVFFEVTDHAAGRVPDAAALSLDFIDDLKAGRMAAAHGRLDPVLAARWSEDDLQEWWRTLTAANGAFLRVEDPVVEQGRLGLSHVTATVVWEKGPLRFRITVWPRGAIEGVRLLPRDAPVAPPATRPAPADLLAGDVGDRIRHDVAARLTLERIACDVNQAPAVRVAADLTHAVCNFANFRRMRGTSEKQGWEPLRGRLIIEPDPFAQRGCAWVVTGTEQLPGIRLLVSAADLVDPLYASGEGVERILRSLGTEFPARLLDMDSGREVALPPDVEQGSEPQLFHWVESNGVDLMAQAHDHSWTLITSLALGEPTTARWDRVHTESVRQLIEQTPLEAAPGTESRGPLVLEDRMFGYKAYRLSTAVPLPVVLPFRTATGALGVIQIEGFASLPAGIKIRYQIHSLPAAAEAPAFAPPVERTLRYFRDGRNHDVLWLANGALSTLRAGFFEGSEAGNREYLHQFGPGIFFGFAPDAANTWRYGLAAASMRFARVPGSMWDEPPSAADAAAALAAEESAPAPVLGRFETQGATLHLLPDRVQLPATLIFQDARGDWGVLQVLAIDDKPAAEADPIRVTVRYRLAAEPGRSVIAAAEQASAGKPAAQPKWGEAAAGVAMPVRPARLQFRLVAEDRDAGLWEPLSTSREDGESVLLVRTEVLLDEASIAVVSNTVTEAGYPHILLRFNAAGTKRFEKITAANAGRQMAIVLDGRVVSAPVIRQPVTGGVAVISGGMTAAEAEALATQIRQARASGIEPASDTRTLDRRPADSERPDAEREPPAANNDRPDPVQLRPVLLPARNV